jgi:hypothetical protein
MSKLLWLVCTGSHGLDVSNQLHSNQIEFCLNFIQTNFCPFQTNYCYIHTNS